MSRTVASLITAEERVQEFMEWWTTHYPSLFYFVTREAERIAPRKDNPQEALRVATALFVGLHGLAPLITRRRNEEFSFLNEMAQVAAPLPHACREARLRIVLSRENLRKHNEATALVVNPNAQEEVRNAIVLIAMVACGGSN